MIFSKAPEPAPELQFRSFPNSLMLIHQDVISRLPVNQTRSINTLLERGKVAEDLPES